MKELNFLYIIIIISIVLAVYNPWFICVAVTSLICHAGVELYIKQKLIEKEHEAAVLLAEVRKVQVDYQTRIDEMDVKVKAMTTRLSYSGGNK